MRRLLYLCLWLLPACSILNDFDAYDFEADAALEERDPRGKPRPILDGGPELEPDGETGPEPREDGAQAALDAGDAQTVVPTEDAAQALPEAGSTPDAAQRTPGPLEGSWDVELELLNESESCAGHARLELDGWQVERLEPGSARLHGAAWTLIGALSGPGESVGMFEGQWDGATWQVTLVRDGAELGGQLTRTTLGGNCRVTRMVRGVR